MDVENKHFDDEGNKNEAKDGQLGSEGEGTDECKIILQETFAEIQSYLKTEELGTRDNNSDCAQITDEKVANILSTDEGSTGGEIRNVLPHDAPPLGQAVATDSLEVSCNVREKKDAIEILHVPGKSNEKGTNDHQISRLKNETGDKVITLEIVHHSEIAPANNKKENENISTVTEKVQQPEKETESVKHSSATVKIETPSKTKRESWDMNVLLIHGLTHALSGDLKQLLNTVLGVGCHRLEPRRRGDSVLRVHFSSKDVMEVARELLHKQDFLGKRMMVAVENQKPQKRKAENLDEVVKPPEKKMKQSPFHQHMKQLAYVNQIAKKKEEVYLKLQHIAKCLIESYPMYDGLIRRREQDNNGLICPIANFSVCPPNQRFVNRCKFSVGTDNVTGQHIVGIRAAVGPVRQVESVQHNFPPHVVKAAKVFENIIRAEGRCKYKFWHELIIRTNVARDLMMVVHVKCPEDLAADRKARLNKELKQFFENGEGRNCRVTSLYTRVTYTTALVPEQRTLVMGTPYIEETVLGIKLQLLPGVPFWSNTAVATTVCKGVEEMLSLTKRKSLVEVGFGLGLVGLHLSKFAGEVLSMIVDQTVKEAQKNAACNNVTNAVYFGGSPKEALSQIAGKISHDKACAVLTCNEVRCCADTATMEALRKISKVRRLVLVTEMSKACCKAITKLCCPSQENGMGNPFFLVRAVPVDTMATQKGYFLIILMERFGLASLPKSPGYPKINSVMHFTERGSDIRRVAGPLMPLAKEAKGRGDRPVAVDFQGREREFPEWKNKFKQRQREGELRPLMSGGGSGLEAMSSKQRLVEGHLPYSGDQMPWVMEGYHHREPTDHERRRQIEEEHSRAEHEHRRWIDEEKGRRWMEKEQHRREMDSEEFRKWVLEKKSRRYMEEREFKREMEENEFQKWVEEQREREMERINPNISRSALVHEVIADSLREAEISQLSAGASQKLKQLVSEAIRTVGALDREARYGISTKSGVGRINPEDIADYRYGGSDKTMPQSRPFEGGYSQHIREDDNASDRYDAYGRATERSESKMVPQSRPFAAGYSQHIREVDNASDSRYDAYGRTAERSENKMVPQPSLFDDGYSRHIREVDIACDRRYDAYGGTMEKSENKMVPQPRYFEDGYSQHIREVNACDRRYDADGRAVEKSENKMVPQSRHFDGGYSRHIREVDNAFDHRHDAFGGAAERSEIKKVPQSRYFEDGYSRSVVEIDSRYQSGYNVSEGAVRRESNQHQLRSQQSTYNEREVQMPHAAVDRGGSQVLGLRAPFGGSSKEMSRLEGSDFHVRRVYLSDGSTSGNLEHKFGQLADPYTGRGNFVGYHTMNEQQPSHDARQSLLPAVGQNAESYVQGNWNSQIIDSDYIPL